MIVYGLTSTMDKWRLGPSPTKACPPFRPASARPPGAQRIASRTLSMLKLEAPRAEALWSTRAAVGRSDLRPEGSEGFHGLVGTKTCLREPFFFFLGGGGNLYITNTLYMPCMMALYIQTIFEDAGHKLFGSSAMITLYHTHW